MVVEDGQDIENLSEYSLEPLGIVVHVCNQRSMSADDAFDVALIDEVLLLVSRATVESIDACLFGNLVIGDHFQLCVVDPVSCKNEIRCNNVINLWVSAFERALTGLVDRVHDGGHDEVEKEALLGLVQP